jgi:hypothetical protein
MTDIETVPVRRPPTMAEQAIEIASEGEFTQWHRLNRALRTVPAVERIVVYRFADNSVVWRHADEPVLHIQGEKARG